MNDQAIPSTTVSGVTLRPLGGVERWFHQMNQHRPNHFCTAATLDGRIDAAELTKALAALQRRHPLLNVAVADGADGLPRFQAIRGVAIPIRRGPSGGGDVLQREIEVEMSLPIDPFVAPLMRVVLGEDGVGSYLIVSVHHSVCDGLGAVFLIRDIVHALAGAALSPFDTPVSIEYLDAVRRRQEPAEPAGITRANDKPAAAAAATAYVGIEQRARVDSAELSESDTTRLVLAARRHGLTVNALLSAAIVATVQGLAPEWKDRPLRLFSPIDLRAPLAAGEGARVAVGAGLSTFTQESGGDFWALARSAAAQLAPFREAGGDFIIDTMLGEASLAPDTVVETSANKFAYELILSNLGRVSIGHLPGALKVTSLWGPAVLFGFTNEQAVGAITLDGKLRLIHASYTPIASLLDGVIAALFQAIAVD